MSLFAATLSFWSLVPAFLAGLIAFYFVAYVSWTTGAWYVAIPAGIVVVLCAIGLVFVIAFSIFSLLLAFWSIVRGITKKRHDG